MFGGLAPISLLHCNHRARCAEETRPHVMSSPWRYNMMTRKCAGWRTTVNRLISTMLQPRQDIHLLYQMGGVHATKGGQIVRILNVSEMAPKYYSMQKTRVTN
jgi:hypothetical protein